MQVRPFQDRTAKRQANILRGSKATFQMVALDSLGGRDWPCLAGWNLRKTQKKKNKKRKRKGKGEGKSIKTIIQTWTGTSTQTSGKMDPSQKSKPTILE